MNNKKNELIEPLLNSGKIFKLKCKKCESVSVQISKQEKPDTVCFECGGKCEVLV
ncbi:MAG: hypothetical protein RSD47_05160 [Romboutsia sp.]